MQRYVGKLTPSERSPRTGMTTRHVLAAPIGNGMWVNGKAALADQTAQPDTLRTSTHTETYWAIRCLGRVT
jgi:hypothetical protein